MENTKDSGPTNTDKDTGKNESEKDHLMALLTHSENKLQLLLTLKIAEREIEQERTKQKTEETKQKIAELEIEKERTKRFKLGFQNGSQSGFISFSKYFKTIASQIQTVDFLSQYKLPDLLEFNSSPPNSAVESEYQSYFFDQLKSFLEGLGSSIRVEDTHNVSYLDGTKPDLSFFCGNDISSEMNVVIIGEIKTKRNMGKFSNKDCGEVLTYGEKCLELQLNRSEIIVFLTDCHIIQFFKIEKRADGEKIYFQTNPSDVRTLDGNPGEGVRKLATLLMFDREALQMTDPVTSFQNHENIRIIKLLGKGVTSLVYLVIDSDTQRYAMKRFDLNRFGSEVIDNEKSILDTLAAVDDRDLKFAIPTVVDRTENTLLIKPVGDLFNCDLYGCHVAQIIQVLKVAHRVGFVHRDIRPENLLRVSDGRALVIDWGFAVSVDFKGPYSGTLHFASDAVLDDLRSNRLVHKVSPQDDLHSLVRAVFAILFKNVVARLLLNENYDEIKKFWQERFKQTYWEKFEELAEKVDYDSLRDSLMSIVPCF